MNSAIGYSEGAEAPEDKTDNELIAQFMGRTRRYESTYQIFVVNLKYHSDWSWLMPVVEKIESLGFSTTIAFDDVWGVWMNIMVPDDKIIGHGNSKIEAVYNAVAEFIKWHNLESLKNKPI